MESLAFGCLFLFRVAYRFENVQHAAGPDDLGKARGVYGVRDLGGVYKLGILTGSEESFVLANVVHRLPMPRGLKGFEW
jgi:hypothetical protein